MNLGLVAGFDHRMASYYYESTTITTRETATEDEGRDDENEIRVIDCWRESYDDDNGMIMKRDEGILRTSA